MPSDQSGRPFTSIGDTGDLYGRPELPFVPAIRVPAGCDLIFVSGALGAPKAGDEEMDLRAETRRCFENLAAVLALSDAGLADVVSITKLLVDIERDNETIVAVLNEFFPDHLPTSTTFEVARLVPPDLRIEINAIAAVRPADR